MNIDEITETSFSVEMSVEESVLVNIFILGMNDEKISGVGDLIAHLLCICCDHCADHLADPTKELTEIEEQMRDYADLMNEHANVSIH